MGMQGRLAKLRQVPAGVRATALVSGGAAGAGAAGIGGRLARLKAAAEERGPLEDEPAEDDNEFQSRRPEVPRLPALAEGEVVFSASPEERARLASGNAGLDCETFLIQPGRNTPRLVVTGYQQYDGTQRIVTGVRDDGVVDPTNHARGFLAFTERLLREALSRKTSEATVSTTDGHVGGLLINQNIPFDFSVIAESAHQADIVLGTVGQEDSWLNRVLTRVFEMLDLGIVEDTMLREQLLDLAEGALGKDNDSLTKDGNPRRKKYSLAKLAQQYLNIELDKTSWRTGYGKYVDQPITVYPEGAVQYLTDDVESALHVGTRQMLRAQLHGLPPGARIPNAADQSKAAFAFQLMSSWGVRTDLSKTQKLDADLDHWTRKLLGVLQETGLVRKEGKGAGTSDTKKTKALVVECYNAAKLPVPLTKPKNDKGGGNVSLKGSVLEDIAMIRLRGSSEDVYDDKGEIDESELFKEPLYAYSQYKSFQKLQTTYVPVLRQGTQVPINAGYNIIKETGRISCYKPNLTNLPRGGTKTVLQRLQSRVREAFIPREGFVFCSTDLDVAELCGLAQICIWMTGSSRLADAINAGLDPHLLMAAEQLLHIPYEEALARKKEKVVADMRQMAKSASFGLPGGLGVRTFIDFCKASYNVYLTEDEARELKEKWFMAWPEMRQYFRMIAAMMRGFDDKGEQVGDIEQFVSGRIRGKTRYTAACNTTFQGLIADAAKAALYEMQKECYLVGGAMYGARPVVFIHDEIIVELPEHLAAEYAQVQADIFVKVVQGYCPDVKIRSTPALMRAWYKGVEAVYDRKGRMIPWDPGTKYEKDGNGRMVPELPQVG